MVFRQLHYITNREEIFDFSDKKKPYLCGLQRFANAYWFAVDKRSSYIYEKEFNFVGRKAYIYSLKDETEIVDKNSTFLKKDGYLVGNYKSSFLPFRATEAEIKIKINDKMICEITDNSQVDENTKFND